MHNEVQNIQTNWRDQPKVSNWASMDENTLADILYEQFRLAKRSFCFMKWAGLCDYPHRIVRGEVTKAYKLYTRMLCLASVGLSIQSVAFVLKPSLIPDYYMSLKIREVSSISRYVMLMWCLAATATRLAMSTVFNCDTYSTNLKRTLIKILSDPCLGAQLTLDTTVHSLFFLFPLICTLMSIVWAVTVVLITNGSFLDPYFYIFLLENVLHSSATMYSAAFCGGFCWNFVLPLLRITAKQFEAAVQSVNVDILETAITCHDKCWELIRFLDQIASILVGINLSMAVPLFAIIVTNLDLAAGKPLHFALVASFISVCLTSLGAVTISAASVNTAAHVPDEILTATTPPCAEFHERARQFRSRFHNRSIGYTFFGLATFRKKTILTVLNLVTTYIIVGFQMKNDTVRAQHC